MIRSLTIRDFVIVDQLELEFSSGFSVLTGETGAGKSILIDALSLALGERGESGMVRAGCERAEITAEFDITALPELQNWLQQQELADDQQCLMRRVLYTDGRSRGFINGSAATMQQLREAGDFLVDIYSQHAHHSLLKPAAQRELLDTFGGLTGLSASVARLYSIWRELHTRRLEAERNSSAYAEELADLRDAVRELVQVGISTEEWESLQQEHSRLAHAASLLEGTEACRDSLAEGDAAALHQLHGIQHKLQELLEYDPALQEAIDSLEPAIIQLQETDRFLKKYLTHAELDPQRLLEIDNRIQTIHSMARKHRVRPEELSDLQARWQARVVELEGLADDGTLKHEEASARRDFDQLAEELSQKRTQAAKLLGEKVSSEMQHLALSGGQFAVRLNSHDQPAPHGMEQAEFLVAGHTGVEPRALAKVASGGELSRISLAIRVITAQQGTTPCMIFDEVDVGIGGSVAEVVGRLLKRLGETRQVLVITHLPQVAAQGSHHLQVSKSVIDNHTLSHIEKLDQEQRIEEIARMLGGVEITETTRKHAAEMLGQ